MNSEKQQLASAVKHQVQVLQQTIEVAEAAGLIVQIELPSRYTGDNERTLVVGRVFEKIVY